MAEETPTPEDQLRNLFAAVDGIDQVVAVVTGLRTALMRAGWSAAGAEAIVVAQWSAACMVGGRGGHS